MLKTLLAASAATAALCGSAFAADLPRRAAPVVVPVAPAFTWTGFYIGGNAGYITDLDRYSIATSGVAAANIANVAAGARPPLVETRSRDGFTGGGQVGFNYQVNFVVFGVEADIAYTDFGTTGTAFGTPVAGAPGGLLNTFRQELDYLGTVRGRVGLAFDRVLLYGTGGFAYGQVQNTASFANAAGAVQFFGRTDRIDTGYAFGAGVEYAVPTDSFFNAFNIFGSNAVTLKAEYLHFDLGTSNVNVAALPSVTAGAVSSGAYISRFETKGDLFRAGLNFKFGTY